MDDDLYRYHRQMLLPELGEKGQRKLLESTVLVLGCGALGTVAANMLARAGVGHLVIVDRDFIEITNLQRQVLFDEQDIADNLPKAEAAKNKIARINSQVKVTAIVDDINYRNIEKYAAGVDSMVDGLDNFETRYLANDCAVKHGIPWIYGGALGTVGAAYTILPHSGDGRFAWETNKRSRATPCLRCIFEEVPPPGSSPTCDTAGVLGAAVGIVANFQVAETLKVLSGNFHRVCPTMLNFDLWANSFRQLKVAATRERVDCPCCKHGRFEYLEGKAGSSTTTLCGSNSVQLTHRQCNRALDFRQLADRLRSHGTVSGNEHMLRAEISDNGNAYELTLFADGRAIIKGTREGNIARSLYAKYVGA